MLSAYPSVVRWDPRREDETYFVQSASLRSTYYFIQIAIHRSFIPSSRKGSSLSFAALAICASAARANSHVADALRKRYPLRTSSGIIVRALSFVRLQALVHVRVGVYAVACICFGRRSASEFVGCEEIGHIT